MTRARLGTAVRILVASGLTAILLWRADPAAVLDVTLETDLRYVALAVGLVLVDRALMAWRWLMLLGPVTDPPRPGLGAVMRIFFVSTFVGTFLPSGGSDVVRAYSLSRLDVAGGASVASVFMDRVLGVLSVLLLAVVGLYLAPDLARHDAIRTALLLTGAGCALTAAAVFSRRAARWAGLVVSHLPGRFVRKVGHGLLDAIRRYAGAHVTLLAVLGASIAVQVLRIAQAYCLGRSLGIAAPPAVYFAFVPLILLVILLPVTVSGLGTGQLAFVWLFARAGVGEAPAFALSVLFVALAVVGNLPGALLFAIDGLRRRPASPLLAGSGGPPPPQAPGPVDVPRRH